jgi:CubicO group peptidase (beta-lactamase class C family)
MLRRILPGFLALCLLLSCRTLPKRSETVDVATASAIRSIIDAQMKSQHIPGAVLAIVRDDRVVFTFAAGVRDIEHNLRVTPDTLFPIGSCTKAFTSMEIARSADRGLLSLDDHPRRFLPYLKLADPEADAHITIRDMLSHRTGLKAYADLAAEPGVLTRDEYIRAATAAKPAVPFRTKFQYSNAMYAAAGEIAGGVNHSTWEEVIANDVFRPLGMTSSVSVITDMLKSPDHATGYVFDKTYRATPAPKSLIALAPGGAIASSARDMTHWLRMLTGGGRIDGRQFVSPPMFRELTTPLIEVNPTTSYALGWAVYDWNGLRVVEHNGGSEGISALVSFIPEKHLGFVFLANTSSNSMMKIGNAGKLLFPLLLGQTNPPAPAAAPVKPAQAPLPIAADISVDALLARMIDAAGGETVLRAHTSVEIDAHKSYDNQGILANLTMQSKAPDSHNESEVWIAANREIGRLRIYFNGVRGGQETTFGQDAINDDEANARARRQFAFPQLLALKNLYKTIAIHSDSDETWIVDLTPERGQPTRLIVSQKTALVTGRESEGEKDSFDDYRNVDGEMVPFRTTIADALGTTTITVDSVRFNVTIDDAVFSPHR